MDIDHISRKRYVGTVWWAALACLVIVAVAAGLGRATMNLSAALTDKPDIAIYLLLPDEGIHNISVLRESENERHYLAQTKDGPKLVVLKKGEKEWYVSLVETLHEDATTGSVGQTEEPEEETKE